MAEICTLIIEALNNVPKSFYVVINPKERNDQIIGYAKDETQAERSFVARFYFEIMKIFEKDQLLKKYLEHYIMDVELYKRIIYKNKEYPTLYEKSRDVFISEKSEGVYPDFIFHKGQTYNNLEDQLLIMELKAKKVNEEEFNYDTFKTNLYVEEFNFQNGIYLIVNNNIELIRELFERYREQYYFNEGKCLVIVKPEYGLDAITLP